MAPAYLGIDVGKKKLDCALQLGDKVLDKSCDNTSAGFQALFAWLAKRAARRERSGWVALSATTERRR